VGNDNIIIQAGRDVRVESPAKTDEPDRRILPDDRRHLESLLEIHKRNVHILQEQIAKFGLYAPPYLKTQLEDELTAIAGVIDRYVNSIVIDAGTQQRLVEIAREPEMRDPVVDSLIAKLRESRDPAQRHWIYIALGEIGDSKAVSAIQMGLLEEDAFARLGAETAWNLNLKRAQT
jgi:HEAT repeat protein